MERPDGSPQGRRFRGRADATAIGFTCRNCGNREATYKDGQLIWPLFREAIISWPMETDNRPGPVT